LYTSLYSDVLSTVLRKSNFTLYIYIYLPAVLKKGSVDCAVEIVVVAVIVVIVIVIIIVVVVVIVLVVIV